MTTTEVRDMACNPGPGSIEQKLAITVLAGGSGGESGKSGGEETRLIIDRLVIQNGEIDARIAALGDKDLSTSLPRIVLTDIGRKSGGATPAEIAEQVTNALIARTGSAVTQLGVDQYLGKTVDQIKALGTGVTGDGVKGAVEKGGDALKGLLGN